MMVNVANGPHGMCVSVNVTTFVIVQRVHETYVLAPASTRQVGGISRLGIGTTLSAYDVVQ